MSTSTLITIGIAVLVALIVFWFVRSRGNTSGHIDTTMTGIGAATEAVEDIVESVTHSFEGRSEEPAPESAEPAAVAGSKPAAAKKPAAVKASAADKAPAAKKPAAKAPKAAAEPSPAATAKPSAGKAKMTAIGVPAAQGEPDDLRQIKGVGPKLNGLLTELGILRFDQIAAWGPKEIETVDEHLGTFKGRIERDNWVEQAGYLAKGDVAGFEAKFGKLNG